MILAFDSSADSLIAAITSVERVPNDVTISVWLVPAVNDPYSATEMSNASNVYPCPVGVTPSSNGEVIDIMGLHMVFLQYGYESDVTMIEHSTSGAKITPIVIYGQESFVIAEQKGGLGIKMIFKPTGSSGTFDPLNQRWTLGWYIGNFGVKVKNARHVYAYWASLDQVAGTEIAVSNVKVTNIADTPVSTTP